MIAWEDEEEELEEDELEGAGEELEDEELEEDIETVEEVLVVEEIERVEKVEEVEVSSTEDVDVVAVLCAVLLLNATADDDDVLDDDPDVLKLKATMLEKLEDEVLVEEKNKLLATNGACLAEMVPSGAGCVPSIKLYNVH